MAKERKDIKVEESFKRQIQYVMIITIVLLGLALLFFILAVTLRQAWAIILFVIFFGALAAVSILSTRWLFKRLHTTFYVNMYMNTRNNYRKMQNLQQKMDYYEEIGNEFVELNNELKGVNQAYENMRIVSTDNLYKNLNLEHVMPNEPRVISLNSYSANYKEFILQAESFRNAFMFFYYLASDDFMSDDVYFNLLKILLEEFTEEGVLIAKEPAKHGYNVFLPHIDSLSCFKERVERVTSKATSIKYEAGRPVTSVCKAAVVIYPYSDIEDILPDLRYAVRQGNDLNIYMPERLNRSNKSFYHTALNHNNIAKIFESLSKTKLDTDHLDETKKDIEAIMHRLGEHLSFEVVGVLVYDRNKDHYKVDYESSCTDNPKDFIFTKNGEISNELVNTIAKYSDLDSSYAFSRRSSIAEELGKMLDIYGIRSGYFFIVREFSGRIRSVIYYLNKTKDLMIDVYNRETLMIFSSTVASFSRQIGSETEVARSTRRFDSLLKLTDYNLYTVARETHNIVELSQGLEDKFSAFKPEEKCYKKLFGLDAPCADCPLISKGKKYFKWGNKEFVTSLAFERGKNEYVSLLIAPHDNQYHGISNRYDSQLLIHSFYGLNEKLDNLFLSKSRGYVLLVSVDNMQELLENYGEEGYQTRLRFFFKNVRRNEEVGDAEIYVFHDNKFAFVLPEEGRADVLTRSEIIYTISQFPFDRSDENEIKLSCTYVAFEYPNILNTGGELIRSMDRYIKDNYKLFNKEQFLIAGSDYMRDVSRERFIIYLLNEALKADSLSIKFLPEVRGSAKKVIGAEILLRLTDVYRNKDISPFEFIPIATKYGNISKITEYLVSQVGMLYQKYGLTSFKLAGLKSLSLNIDTLYFEDETFITKIENLVSQYHLPKGFLRFEFTEDDIAKNYEKLKPITRKLKTLDVYLTVDRYTGEHLTIDKAKDLGFENFKFAISVMKNITNDASRIEGVKDLVNNIKEHKLSYCFMGIETKFQYQLAQEIDEDFIAAGYYFYEPLDIDVLLDKLRLVIIQD